jgi:hypothetical protein
MPVGKRSQSSDADKTYALAVLRCSATGSYRQRRCLSLSPPTRKASAAAPLRSSASDAAAAVLVPASSMLESMPLELPVQQPVRYMVKLLDKTDRLLPIYIDSTSLAALFLCTLVSLRLSAGIVWRATDSRLDSLHGTQLAGSSSGRAWVAATASWGRFACGVAIKQQPCIRIPPVLR